MMEVAQGTILVEDRGDARWIHLNRVAAKNALTLSMLAAIPGVVSDAELDGCRVLVLTGAGDDSFCAGFDLGELEALDDSTEALTIMAAAYRSLERSLLPTVARVDGWCIGAGLELALSCDLRASSPTSVFALPAARIGVIYPPDGLRRICRAAGVANAIRLAVLAERVLADEARDMGLVHAVREPLDGLVDSWIELIDAGDAVSITGMKATIYER